MRFQEFAQLREDAASTALSNITKAMSWAAPGADMDISGYSGDKSATATGTATGTDAFKAQPGGNMPVKAREISQYLTSKGLDDAHRLGMLANIQAESNFDSGVMGDHMTSGGLFQHHASRFSNMVKAVGENWRSNWKGQVDFALSEPAGRSYLATQFKSPEAAVEWWTKIFEVPANVDQRVAERLKFLKNFA
jgi:hypothetical protein